LQQANGFLAQQCPAERCPKKTTKGPSFSDPRFKISYRKAVNEWLVFFSVTVEAEVDCKVQKK